MVDVTNEAFFAKIFDKYNLITMDVDANFERGYEFEPQASYHELIEFLEGSRPDRFKKKSSRSHSKGPGNRQPDGSLGPLLRISRCET